MIISKWKLCEVLWPGENKSKVDINLHTTIYKMKRTLRNSGIHIDIKFINKAYIMNIDDIYSDVDEFQSLIDRISFVKHYNYLKALFKEELGIEPGNRIKLMYKMINIT